MKIDGEKTVSMMREKVSVQIPFKCLGLRQDNSIGKRWGEEMGGIEMEMREREKWKQREIRDKRDKRDERDERCDAMRWETFFLFILVLFYKVVCYRLIESIFLFCNFFYKIRESKRDIMIAILYYSVAYTCMCIFSFIL